METYETYKIVNKERTENYTIYHNVISARSFTDEAGKRYGELTLSDGNTATFNRMDWAFYKLDWVHA